MRSLVLLLLFIITQTAQAQTAQAEFQLKPYEAHYIVGTDSMTLAKIKVTLKQDDDHWIYEYVSKPAGFLSWFSSDVITETAVFSVSEDGLRGINYSNHSKEDGMIETYAYNWQSKRVQGREKKSDRKIDVSLEQPVFDRLSNQLNLGLMRVNNHLIDHTYLLESRKAAKYQIEWLDEKKINAAQTTLQAQGVHLWKNKKRDTWIWYAKEWNYLPIKIDQREKNELLIMTLDKVKWL